MQICECECKAAESLNCCLHARVITFPRVRIVKNFTVMSVIYRSDSCSGNWTNKRGSAWLESRSWHRPSGM